MYYQIVDAAMFIWMCAAALFLIMELGRRI